MDVYVEQLSAPGALTAALNWYRAMSSATPVDPVGVPTTYVWGRHDVALIRPTAEATAKYMAGPYTFVDLDAGHWLPETEPDAVSDAILDRVRAAPGSA